MIDLLKELGDRKATPAISALPVCAFPPLGAALHLFIFLCPHLPPQPHHSCNILLLCGFSESCWCPSVPSSTSPSSPCAPTLKPVSILVLKWNSLQGHFKAMSFSDQLLWRGVKLRHSCTKLEGMSPWMGLGTTTKQSSAFALWHRNLYVSWLSSFLTGWKVIAHHFLGCFFNYNHHRLQQPLLITSKTALPTPCCFTLWGVNPMSLKWQQWKDTGVKSEATSLQHSQRHSAPTVQQITLKDRFFSIQNNIL